MDVNSLIEQLQNLAGSHPYLALSLILFVTGALIRGKAALVFYFLGFMALLQEFSLFETFVEFLKGLPDKVGTLTSMFGGG